MGTSEVVRSGLAGLERQGMLLTVTAGNQHGRNGNDRLDEAWHGALRQAGSGYGETRLETAQNGTERRGGARLVVV